MPAPAQALLETPLGSLFSNAEATELADAAAVRTVARGQALFRAGDRGTALYVILTGALDVVLGQGGPGDTVVASLGPGQIVGELEVMTQSARVASLVATEEASVLELPVARFDELVAQARPAAVKLLSSIAKALARRLAAVNQRIVTRTGTTGPVAVPRPPPKAATAEHVVEVADADVVPVIADEDLDMLDKLWGSAPASPVSAPKPPSGPRLAPPPPRR
jgi:CRP-like cAMP-binding protein